MTCFFFSSSNSFPFQIDNEDVIKMCVTLCLSAMRKQPASPEISYLATSTVDLNNAALCHVIAKMIKADYPLYRLSLLTAFCITPSQESLDVVEEAYNTTPTVSSAANPSNLPAAVHCGVVQCMSELLPRKFTPKYRHCDWFTSKPDWFTTKKLCERLLRSTKFVSSQWTLSNGEVVTVKTYVKPEQNQLDMSEGDKMAGDTEESDICDTNSMSDDGETVDGSDEDESETESTDDDDEDDDTVSVENLAHRKKNGLANGAYNLRPSRKRIAVSGTDEDTDISSWNEEDDSWTERDSSECTPDKGKVKVHPLNGSEVKGWSPSEKRKDSDINHNSADEKQQTKRGRGRPRKYPENLVPKNENDGPKRGRGRPRKTDLNSEIPNKKLCTRNSDSDAKIDEPLSAISAGAEDDVPASIVAVSNAVKPIQTVLKSMMNSNLEGPSDTPVTSASNNHAVCEGHIPCDGDPYLLLKSKESRMHDIDRMSSKNAKESRKTVSGDDPNAKTSVSVDRDRLNKTTAVTCNAQEYSAHMKVMQDVEQCKKNKSFISKSGTICTPTESVDKAEVIITLSSAPTGNTFTTKESLEKDKTIRSSSDTLVCEYTVSRSKEN